MPTRETVEAFVDTVEAGKFIEAMEAFYAPDATAQENNDAPRVGLPALLDNERKTLAAFGRAQATCVRPIFIDGDEAIIHWAFTFTTRSGGSICLEELVKQKWKDEKLVSERFFYDPKQMRP